MQRFQRIATTLAGPNAEGLNAQTVNDLLSMYVGAASQHVHRMSFVPDTQVTAFLSHLIQRDVTSPMFFPPLKLGGLGVGSAIRHPNTHGYHSVPRHRHPFSPRHHNSEPNLLNFKPHSHYRSAFLLLKPHGSALRQKEPHKRSGHHHPTALSQAAS